MDKAVILARGLGSRMRKSSDAQVSDEQSEIAATGLKAMIPIDRPFLDYVLHNLANAGYRQVCLVIGPEHKQIREYYTETISPSRIEVVFAIQEEPKGTADAVLAAETFSRNDHILVINSDNYYPLESLQGLRELSRSGLAAFEVEGMIAGSNIAANRITKFAAIKSDEAGYMFEIIEKPEQQVLDSLPKPICISMNCWRFGPAIFEGCKSIELSARGELELPDAVAYTMAHLGERYYALTIKAPVLDLSSRDDIAPVVERLKGSEVNL